MRKIRFVGVRVIFFGTLAVIALGFILSALWNALIPAIFGLPAITFWQALGLFAISRILFGRFGGRPHRFNPRFARGWGSLTPEERERFRAAMGHGCDRTPDGSAL